MNENSSFSSRLRLHRAAGALLRLSAIVCLGAAHGAWAATSTWSNTGTDWNTAANWSAGLPTSGTGNGALFNATATSNPNISSSVGVGTLQFSTATASGYTISSSSGSTTLTLNSPGASGVSGNWAIFGQNTSGTNTITAPVILAPASGSTLLFFQTTGGALSLSGTVSGTATLQFAGGGRISLSNSGNSYSGGTVIARSSTAEITSLGNAGANGSLGTGAVTIGSTASIGGTANTAGTLNYRGSGETSNKAINFNYDGTIDTTGATGTGLVLTGPIAVGGTGRTITLRGDTSGNAINSDIPDNTATKLTKTGTGTWAIAGNNTYTGVTTVSGGVLQLNSTNAISGGIGATGGTSAITVNGGVIGLGNGDFSRGLGTGSSQIQFTGSGGFSAHGTNRAVNLGGSSANVTWATGSFVPNGSSFILGASTADRSVDFQNGIVLGTTGANTRTIQVDNGSGAVDAKVSGAITHTGGTQSLTKTGLGTLELTGANTYNGATTVSAGTMLVNGTHTGAGAYSVDAGGRLGGEGSISTAGNAGITLSNGGQLAPGGAAADADNLSVALGTGTLDISAGVTGDDTGALLFDLNAMASSDKLTLSSGTLAIGSSELEFGDFSFSALGSFGAGTYTLFDTNAAISGSLGSSLSGTIGSYSGTLSFANGGQDLVLTVVPEPNAAMIFITGVGVLLLVKRRRK